MKTVILNTESYLFRSVEGECRAIPFYKLSIEEIVVFENSRPKYLIDFNRRTKPFIEELAVRVSAGEDIEIIIQKIGKSLGKKMDNLSQY